MEYRGRQWHDLCFCCCVCRHAIGANSFIPKADEIYCIQCYQDKYATRCVKCTQVIVSSGITFRGEPWHKHCFNCAHCNQSLAGRRFTTREVDAPSTPQGNSALQYSQANKDETPTQTKDCDLNNNTATDSGNDQSLDGSTTSDANNKAAANLSNKQKQQFSGLHSAFCMDCYALLFARKCHACGCAITGSGGTRFVTFQDLNWHSDCFKCDECEASLVGKGFITDGPDSILCSECARAKLL